MITNSTTTLTSSAATSVSYNELESTLTVTFRNSGTYIYFQVPSHVYTEMIGAQSSGRYFARNIRNNYEYRRVF